MSADDLRFANNPRHAIEQSSAVSAWIFLFFAIMLLVSVVLWASWATVEKVSSGIGKVIPSRQLQLVESLEPGTIQDILVQEGDRVRAGQPLIRMDDTNAKSRLGQLVQKQLAFSAEAERLKAQAGGAQKLEIKTDAHPEILEFMNDQVSVFESEKLSLQQRLSALKNQLNQKRENLNEVVVSAEKQAATLKIAERELELTQNLFKKRAIPELEFLQSKRIVEELRGDLRIVEATKLRINAEIEEARDFLEAEKSAFVAKAQERLSKVNAELSITAESLKAAEDRVNRTVFHAPVSGVVNKVQVSTIGEVVQSGTTLVEIVPEDDKLLIEARIRPEDIAFIRPELPTIIRLTAYDYTRYGTLSGKVKRISADTITDENRETFYQIVIETDENQELPDQIRIIPGMIASVDISTGKRSILEYLLKPVLRIKDRAFRDPK